MIFAHTVGSQRYVFSDLKTLLARATPARSGDALAGIAAERGRRADRRAHGLGGTAADAFPGRSRDPV